MRRRSLLGAAVAAPALALLGVPGTRALTSRPEPRLLSEGVATGADGVLHVLPPGAQVSYLPGTRLPASSGTPPWAAPGCAGLAPEAPQRADLEQAARDRRAGASLPPGRWRSLAADALDDLLALTGPVLGPDPGTACPAEHDLTRYPPGAVVAGPVGWWRYTWPRDSSFAALALARVGLIDQAVSVLAHLAGLQRPDATFAARYTASGQRPDSRPDQSDAVGWFTWATGQVLEMVALGGDEQRLARLQAAMARSTRYLLELTSGPTGMPPASPDYWETPERFTTLSTAATALLGLETAAASTWLPGEDNARAAARSQVLREAMELSFGPGWGRYPRAAGASVSTAGTIDAAITLVLPPFTTPLAGAQQVRAQAWERMARPAGGVAPGEDWRRDGVSWTPETALLAWSAAALGWQAEAEGLLGWLEAHRTLAGALPEKVLADGAPAGPAPLAWTCALVVLATWQLADGSA